MSRLSVRDLTIAFGRRPPVVTGVEFDLEPGGRLGLVGESGSGKTVTALAIMGLLPENARVTGSIRLGDTEIVGLGDRAMAKLRGDRLGMIFQEPMTALDPTMTAGRQVAEAFRLHRDRDAGRARQAVWDMLAAVGFDDPQRIADSYPHQLSGGQRQRVVTAMALINRPAVVLCDEPTTALDVTVQERVLQVLDGVLDAAGASCLFISHDLAVVSQLCSEVAVMLEGRIVERGPAEQVFARPTHPYTAGLVGAGRLDLLEPGTPLPTVTDAARSAR
ncbi:ABC transporter ATP-binding protein [Propioniciclava coleopterorum]|uniref:ABC transporter ATP-binding protein n=1 Tax=Propioniciclava coleopterorum TaxID=2714937 RepID=A0A6G7Y9E0_9ACTN|nr:ABC transporter ATP-binding protein [Propioniciclava coleopterorum]QIK73296.1 ABC transporter ATP-binding protein [Propioniciclava coleopterorum]